VVRGWNYFRGSGKEEFVAYRVLIVDDSPAMRTFVRRVLRASRFDAAECFEAASGREALELLRSQWVDAILTDINMPGMDGEQFLREVEADELLRSIPVVVISTDSTERRIGQMMALGARGYIRKPFQPEELRAELERSLGEVHA
jgi:two-component system, chemotaxis family, chemotaxis protein CheY